MKIYGYARVSSKEQNLDRQIIKLKEYVSNDNIIVDKASGKDLNREGYQALKGPLGIREGDILYVVSLDRISRNKEHIKSELAWFKENKVQLRILDLPTSMIEVPKGQEWIMEMIMNILIEVLASMAEQERTLIKKRQAEGIAAAKAKGKHLGRPKAVVPTGFNHVYMEWKRGLITAKRAMELLNLKRSTFYKLVRIYRDNDMFEKV